MRRLIIGVTACWAALAVCAQAQEAAPTPPTLRGLFITRDDPGATNRTEFQATGAVDIQGVRISTNPRLDLLRDPRFEQSLTRFIGMPITEDLLTKIREAVVLYYRDHSRPVVDVIYPAQDSVDTGVLQLIVVEGVVDRVRVIRRDGNLYTNGWFNAGTLRRPVRIQEGDTVSETELKSDLDWLNRDDEFRTVGVSLFQGRQYGSTAVDLVVDDRFPVKGTLGFDNAGFETLGEERFTAGAKWGNAFWVDHRLGYQFTADTSVDRLKAHSVSYEAPLPWKHVLTLFGVYAEASQSTTASEGIGIDTESDAVNVQGSARYSLRLPPISKYQHELSIGFDFKRLETTLLFGQGATNLFKVDTAPEVAQFMAGYYGLLGDKWGQTTLGGQFYYSPGDLTSANDDAAFQEFDVQSDPEYFYGRISLLRENPLPYGLMLRGRGEVQLASGRLLASEQYGMGGFESVRGYPERISNGDWGWLASVELWSPDLDLGFKDGEFRLIGFWDYASTDLNEDNGGSTILSSVGAGARLNLGKSLNRNVLSIRFDCGYRLREVPSAVTPGETEDRGWRGHIGLNLSF